MPNGRAAKYVKQKMRESKEEIDKSTVKVRDFTIPPSIIGKVTRKKIIKDIKDLTDTLTQQDLIDIYETPNKNNKYSFHVNVLRAVPGTY